MQKHRYTIFGVFVVLLAVPALVSAVTGRVKQRLDVCEDTLAACKEELQACRESPSIVFPGDGQKGAELTYTDNGNGTFTDNNTGLLWEIKGGDDGTVDYANPHDVDNRYTWSASGGDFDGTAKTEFLDRLNGEAFGGYKDWRLPTAKELHSLVDFSEWDPAVQQPNGSTPGLPGATASSLNSSYWSSTFVAGNTAYAWFVKFYNGVSSNSMFKGIANHARAVRGP